MAGAQESLEALLANIPGLHKGGDVRVERSADTTEEVLPASRLRVRVSRPAHSGQLFFAVLLRITQPSAPAPAQATAAPAPKRQKKSAKAEEPADAAGPTTASDAAMHSLNDSVAVATIECPAGVDLKCRTLLLPTAAEPLATQAAWVKS